MATGPQGHGGAVPGDLVVMGRLLAPRGVAGWIKVKTFTETPESLAAYPLWWLGDGKGWRSIPLEDAEVLQAGLSVKLAGVEDRTEAQRLRGLEVAVSRAELPVSAEAIYWVELIGMRVENLEGVALGEVAGLLETGANDVLVVAAPDGGELLIPYIETAVLEIDRAARKIRVAWQADW